MTPTRRPAESAGPPATEPVARLSIGHRAARCVAYLVMPKATTGSLVCVVDDLGRVAMVRSRARQRSRWGFPGGFRRSGESFEATARREVREEVGAPVARLQQVTHYVHPWARHVESLFIGHLDAVTAAGQPGLEIAELLWCEPQALVDLPLTVETRYALDTHLGGVDGLAQLLGRGR